MARKKKAVGGIVPPLVTDVNEQETIRKNLKTDKVETRKYYKAPVQKRVPKKRAPMEVNGAEVRSPKDSELRRGVTAVPTAPKKRRQKKQTPIPKPRPGQAGKLDGKVVRVTPENVTQVYDEKRTTNLPTATPEDMTPAGRPAVEPAVMPKVMPFSQNKKNFGGFAGKHKDVSKATHEALGHLQTMADTEKNSPEHHDASRGFHLAHATVGQIGNQDLHRFLALGHSAVQKLHGTPELANALKVHRAGTLGKLEAGRIAEQSRKERAQQGQQGAGNGS